MYEIGRLCVKLAGRDARKKCVVVDKLDNFYVLIDGQTRRKKCNIKHLEPLDKILAIKQAASHEEVVEALHLEGIEIEEKINRQKTQPKKEETEKEKIKEIVKKVKKVKKIEPAEKEEVTEKPSKKVKKEN